MGIEGGTNGIRRGAEGCASPWGGGEAEGERPWSGRYGDGGSALEAGELLSEEGAFCLQARHLAGEGGDLLAFLFDHGVFGADIVHEEGRIGCAGG